MQEHTKQKIKQTVSLAVGIPATIVAFSVPNEVTYWWVTILGWTILACIFVWNNKVLIKYK